MKKEELKEKEVSKVVIEWEETSFNKPIRLRKDFDTLINVYNILMNLNIELIDKETGLVNINDIFSKLNGESIKEILNVIVWNLKSEDLSLLSIEEGMMIITSFFGELVKSFTLVLNTSIKTNQK